MKCSGMGGRLALRKMENQAVIMHYFAVFLPDPGNGYNIRFPDFPETASRADDLDGCMKNAAELLRVAITEHTAARRTPPVPSGVDRIKVWARARLEERGLPDHGYIYQLFAAPVLDATPVKITVSMAKSVLDEADQKARQLGLTRSGFLAAAVQAFTVR